MEKVKKGFSVCFLLALAMLLLLPGRAFAAGESCSLTVTFTPDGVPAAATEFRLYRVAEVSASGGITLTERFRGQGFSPSGSDEEMFRLMASTLPGIIASEKISPDAAGTTGADGRAVFSNLPAGVYLVMGEPFVSGEKTWLPENAVICLPGTDGEGREQYDVSVNTKWSGVITGETMELEVLKVWMGNSVHPADVVIELYSGSTLVDIVTLGKQNNWRHTWSELPADSMWSVREQIVPTYAVIVERQENRFVVTNMATGESITTPDLPDSPDSPNAPGTPDSPNSGDPTLPQTGLLWWPVPVLAAAGLLLFIAGYLRRRGSNDEEE